MPRDILAELEADAALGAGGPFHELAAAYFAETRDGAGPVSTPHSPIELARRFHEPLPTGARPLDEVAARLGRDVVADANRLYHPMYMGHQVSAPLPAAVWAESVIGALNQSVAVWEMSPTATVVETQVVRWMCDLVGYGPTSGGTLTSGGTEATFAALLAARSRAIPDVWTHGIGERPPVVVCGEHAHYAVSRAVGEMGPRPPLRRGGALARLPAASRRPRRPPGRAGDRRHARDGRGRHRRQHRRRRVRRPRRHRRRVRLARPLAARGRRARRLGAPVPCAPPPRGRPRPRALDRLGSSQDDAAPALGRHDPHARERELEGAFAQAAPYLFHARNDPEEFDGAPPRVWDQGVRSFQCSRRATRSRCGWRCSATAPTGWAALRPTVRHHARPVRRPARARRVRPLHEPDANILCFRFVGDGTLDVDALDAVNHELRERYNRSGAGWITATNLAGRRVLRVTIMNPRTTAAHTARLLDGMAAEGARSSRVARTYRTGPSVPLTYGSRRIRRAAAVAGIPVASSVYASASLQLG
jgi:L-2,4-diaminobutyrate decarboxylase